MSARPSRRGFLGAAAALGTAAALPVICSGPSYAAGAELPVVTNRRHPAAHFAPGTESEPGAEPLNASVACGLHGRREGIG
ncbi:twin-arginine translocation signal domain-containing protein [Streptomyces sp. A7024]|uniref:Twin-arginine translocation signal domain-containing protein n=1 Tax=Streptomyces coryli TaxID=1128680 RepID=A0A6G4TS40_9ACTN|nr:twin-arginine translocation signal domain-containing protein [Streptomyces coryli]